MLFSGKAFNIIDGVHEEKSERPFQFINYVIELHKFGRGSDETTLLNIFELSR